MSDNIQTAALYDYSNNTGSSHASIYKKVFDNIHQSESIKYEIEMSTIDSFCDKKNISLITLLKIDTEGHEYQVLQGAKRMLTEHRIQAIHFEFNEMNAISKVFMNDFIELLPDFSFFLECYQVDSFLLTTIELVILKFLHIRILLLSETNNSYNLSKPTTPIMPYLSSAKSPIHHTPLKTAVLFLIFNRPDTTRQVFEAIRKPNRPDYMLLPMVLGTTNKVKNYYAKRHDNLR